MAHRIPGIFATAVFALAVASAQKTTNFTYTITITGETDDDTRHTVGSGFGSLAAVGPVAINLDVTQPIDQGGNPLDDYKGTISFVFNRLDSFDVSVTIPNGNGNPPTVNGTITGGNGAYQGATGQVAFTFTNIVGPRSAVLENALYTLSATGSVTVAGKTTAINLPNTQMTPFGSEEIFREVTTGTINASPLGNGTFRVVGHGGDNNTRQTGISTVTFNSNDSISFFLSFLGDTPPANTPFPVAGGTGAYAGATGSFTIASINQSTDSITFTGSGSVTTGGATALPVITDVSTAFGNSEISPNGWTVIKGNNLVPATTPASGVNWSSAPEFASGKMPTNLQGISVTVNGVPAYVYFYCSAATDKDCASDQINILTPLDNLGDNVPAGIVVTNGSVSSVPFVVNEAAFAEPSFLLFSTKGHVVGVHLDGTLLGPITLYPGLSTPAKVGETVLLFPIGYGLPEGGATQGSATQSGAVQGTVSCSISGIVVQNVPATVISPGLTQLNLTIPANTPSGDNLIFCGGPLTGGSGRTPPGNLIAVQ